MGAVKALLAGHRQDVDMTKGNVARHLLMFAFPLLLGNLFQQFYNMVDTWVVGNYVSNEAFSAVGTVGPIINTLIGFFTGFSSGSSVVISQYYGAKRYDKVRDAVHTCLCMTLVLGVALTALGVGITPLMLDFIDQPPEVLPEGTAYLTIYFSGIMGLLVYNMGAAILRAVGDSRRPFLFLVVSALLNIALDLLLVLVFHLGVRGVAYATIISQAVSAILVVVTLLRSKTCVRVTPRALRIHLDLLRKIVRVGIPSALQLSITAFSNVFVQSYINFFGADCMSGWTAYLKMDQVIILPLQSIAMASTTFVSQNLGNRDVERAKHGLRTAILMSMGITAVLILFVCGAAPWLVAFFNSKPEVVKYGTLFLRCMSPFFLLCCVNQILAGALRGSGNSRVPMVIMIFSFVFFRQVYLFIMANFISNTVIPIAMAYPGGWLVAATLSSLYYWKVGLTKTRIVDEGELLSPPDRELQEEKQG